MPHTTLAAAPRTPAHATLGEPVPSRHELVAALLDGTCRLADVPRLAALLGAPAHGTYVVVAVAGSTPAARVALRAALTPSRCTHWHTTPSVDHGIVRITADDRIELAGPVPDAVRAGVGLPVGSLGAVDGARRLADLALTLAPPDGGLVRLDERLPAAIMHRAGELGGALVAHVLGPVLAEPAADRDVLLRTFATWFDADGSTAAAAAQLGCHRNTVTNRLRRLERLTGRRTDRPRDLVELTLALLGRRPTATAPWPVDAVSPGVPARAGRDAAGS